MPQEGVLPKAVATSTMPVMGMFAMLSVAGLAAGVGATIYRRTRRSTSRDHTYSQALNAMEHGPME